MSMVLLSVWRSMILAVGVLLLASLVSHFSKTPKPLYTALGSSENRGVTKSSAQSGESLPVKWINGRCERRDKAAEKRVRFVGECGWAPFSRFPGVDLREQSFRGADLLQSLFIGSTGDEAEFTGARLTGASFRWSSFRGTDFSGAGMKGILAYRVSFRQSRFVNADLREAKFNSSDLRATDLRGADLRGALLLSVALDGALIDSKTKLPFSRQLALRLGMKEVSRQSDQVAPEGAALDGAALETTHFGQLHREQANESSQEFLL
jgi:uncharacterized protein YjbI with pentapeptide repeats